MVFAYLEGILFGRGQFTFTTESTKFPRVVASVEGGNGTVSPERIDAGNDPVTVVFTPEVGYAVEKVTLNGVDALGTTATFSVTPKGENTVKAVKFNGHTLTASDGKYTAKIVATDNIIEVIYDEVAVAPPPSTSSNSCSTTSSLWAIVSAVLFCGLFLIKG